MQCNAMQAHLDERLGDVAPAELAEGVLRRLLHQAGLARPHVAVRRRRRAGPAGEVRDELAHLVHALLRRAGAGDGVDDGGPDDGAVGAVLAEVQDVLPLGDAEADGDGDARVLADARDELRQVRRQVGPGARHAGDAHGVDPAGGGPGQLLDALVGGGGREERHGAEGVLLAHGQDAARLLHRQIDHDETVDAGRYAVLAQLVYAASVLEERVTIAHEHHRNGQTLRPRCLHSFNADFWSCYSVGKCNLIRSLNSGSIGHRIREWNANLNNISTALLKSKDSITTEISDHSNQKPASPTKEESCPSSRRNLQ